MQILLANAKIMLDHSAVKPLTVPRFHAVAQGMASELAQLDIDEMSRQLGCSRKIAAENCLRFRDFPFAPRMPAIMAYNGQAYKHLQASTLSRQALKFAQGHLWITCFLYGLLRPLDGIAPYRIEHGMKLQATGDVPLDRYWRELLTDVLIDSVKADDGTLIHLSTKEFESLFDWKRVCREVQVIQPLFYVRNGQKESIQAVWAKTGRGALVRYIIENQLKTTKEIENFSYAGFLYEDNPERFVKDI